MEIQGLARQSLAVSQIVRAQVGTGRIALPVSGSSLYANLKHITGITGQSNQPAFSLSQLRSLDNLIDRLKLLKGEAVGNANLENSSENDIIKMMDEYRQQLYSELHKKNPYRAGIDARGLSLDIFV